MEWPGKIAEKIFKVQNDNGYWKLLPKTHKYYPDCLHYVPTYKASVWTLVLLADLEIDPGDQRIQEPLKGIKEHLFDPEIGIYSLKESHFPIPCLNGNMVYLDCYFNGKPGEKSRSVLKFFNKYQRFDDGEYLQPVHKYCSNKSCYGKHTCYWGVVKLLKGISFIPETERTGEIMELREKCIRFVLLHNVCFSSRNPDRIMADKMDLLTFPNMYKSDFLEILWVLKREKIMSAELNQAVQLLKSKQNTDGSWNLERVVHNMVTAVGKLNEPNPFITKRANEVLGFYDKCDSYQVAR
jgi:hypothetical protein